MCKTPKIGASVVNFKTELQGGHTRDHESHLL